jgi:DNA-binding NtrC family response regulator
MILEEDAILNLSMREVIESFGHKVVSFYSAIAAMEAISEGDYIDGLVTDIDLGAGPDGFHVASFARRLHPSLAVVYASGTAVAQHAAYGVRGSVFVSKPYHPHQILDAFSRLIHLEAA